MSPSAFTSINKMHKLIAYCVWQKWQCGMRWMRARNAMKALPIQMPVPLCSASQPASGIMNFLSLIHPIHPSIRSKLDSFRSPSRFPSYSYPLARLKQILDAMHRRLHSFWVAKWVTNCICKLMAKVNGRRTVWWLTVSATAFILLSERNAISFWLPLLVVRSAANEINKIH